MATTVTRRNGNAQSSNPFIRKAQAAGKNPGDPGAAPTSDVTPEEVAAIRASITAREQAPSQQQQTPITNWRQVADQLGDPYSVEQIPLSKLRLMRRDPVIGFGLSFIKTPHIRAKWYIDAKDINGPNAQVAAHLDFDLRRIMASLVLQWCNILDFGFQAIAKRFEFGIPAGTYVAQAPDGTMSEQPIWSEGGIQPIRWKPFVALPPETVEPIWNPADGSFNGIDCDYSKQVGGSGGGAPAGAGATQTGEDQFQIDLYHSLWAVNERDGNFGSVFGYPRIAYSYRFWWSYWFRWAIADRAFEKKADPSILIYHPEGTFVDSSSGSTIAYSDYALTMGNRMRSGGVITLPSTPYEGANGPTNIREWEIDFTKESVNFQPFDASFDYLDVGKIRSLFIPEQSLIEGKGGCVHPNTPIAAPRDYEKHPYGIPLCELKPGDLVWTYNEQDERFELNPVKNAYKTMDDAELYKLTLDDGSEIIGTPDHPFLTRNGEWKEMIELRAADRLMPLYSSLVADSRLRAGDKEPRVRIVPEENKYVPEHLFVGDALGYERSQWKYNIHHKDGRHLNSHPDNLEYLSVEEHQALHFSDPEFKRLHAKATRDGMKSMTPEQREKMGWKPHANPFIEKQRLDRQSELGRMSMLNFLDSLEIQDRKEFLSNRMKKGWENGNRDFKAYNWKPKPCERCGNVYTPTHSVQKYCSECVEPRRQPYMGRIKRPRVYADKLCSECGETFSPTNGRQQRCKECLVSNHRVISVEKMNQQGEVWDLEIDGPEHVKNFVANGVVVHNTSSRNVAAEFDSSFTESQAVLSVQFVSDVNRYIIPQWLAVNHPEFLQANGTANLVVQGFADEDVAFTQQIIQLIGQQVQGINKLLTMVDLQKILDDAGVPLLDIKEQQANVAKLVADQQANSAPNPVEPRGGSGGTVGVVPAGTVPTSSSDGSGSTDTGGTNGDGNTTGFSYQYIQPREVIYLSTGASAPTVKVRSVNTLEDGVMARYDPDTGEVLMSDEIPDEEKQRYLTAIGEALVGNAQ